MKRGNVYERDGKIEFGAEDEGFEVFVESFEGSPHKSVMPREVLSFVPLRGKLKVVDATVGCGGHSSLILKKNPEAVLLGLDRDGRALEFAERRLSFANGRFQLSRRCFSEIRTCAVEAGWLSADIVLMDLGVSSLQLDDASRGFSYLYDGPLDMRMGTETGIAATGLLNNASREELVNIFYKYGDMKRPGKLADEIIRARAEKKFESTGQLADLCRAIPGLSRMRGVTAPTLCFQAIRIAVNNEIGELEKGLQDALKLLAPRGKIIVISFNSFEDRIVKNFFRTEATECLCPPELFQCACGHKKSLRLFTKKPLIPKEDELAVNKRAAPAKLRVAEKLE